MDLMSEERIMKAAFEITSAFEGGGYHSLQTYDKGLLSYGRFQFTLASGNFERLINAYLAREYDPFFTRDLREQIARKDERLRKNYKLHNRLIDLGRHNTVMQQVQDEMAKALFWDEIMRISIRPRGLRLPLTLALAFDAGIQHGKYHDLFAVAEEKLGIRFKTPPQVWSRTEEELCFEFALARRDRLMALADRMKLAGLRPRGTFWYEQAKAENWFLEGGPDGKIEVKWHTWVKVV